MKTKTDAAKILLNEGWTYEDVRSVLESDRPFMRIDPRMLQTPGSPPSIINNPSVTQAPMERRWYENIECTSKDLPHYGSTGGFVGKRTDSMSDRRD